MNSFSNGGSFVNICGGQQNHELVPSNACQGIFMPQVRLEDMRCRAQNLIANLMSIGIVDLFEVIHIDRQDRQRFIQDAGMSQFIVTPREELAPVVYASEWVRGCQGLCLLEQYLMLLDGEIILLLLRKPMLLSNHADQNRAQKKELICDRNARIMDGDGPGQKRSHIKA